MSELVEEIVDETPPPPPPPRHLTVRISGAAYAVPVSHVREVVLVDAITRVPHAPARMRGLTTVRGRVMPVVDPAVGLGGAPTAIDRDARLVVLAAGARLIGLLVAGVGGVIAGTGGADPLDVDAIARPA